MGATWLILITIVVFTAGYIWYGRFLTKKFDIDPKRATPAHTKMDGIDYIPAKAPILFGHHFSSIAGAGPIIGPIYAAVFGWIPVFLWILIGSVFIGGVHDFASAVASIRHGGKTMGEVIEEHIGLAGKRFFMVFTWFMLVLVIAVFSKTVASIFVKNPATVTSSLLFVALAILFGLSIYKLKISLWLASVIGVGLLFVSVYIGIQFPIHQSYNFWIWILLIYTFIAATIPVWLLLQPRDYLNSFLLYFVLLGGIIGILISNPKVTFPAITQFHTNIGYLFPILFVTVACGAISGFHSLVSSGTTSKQLDSEANAKPVVYGSMLVEGMLAVVALVTAITIFSADYSHLVTEEGGGPIGIFSTGLGGFLSRLGVPTNIGTTLAALAISAFALTSLDTATRLGRFVFQEFFESGKKESFLSSNRYISALATIGFAGILAFSGTSDTLWPLFGSANQLLASLVLMAIMVWLAGLGKKNNFVKYPMYFMFCVTVFALGNLIYENFAAKNIILLVISILLFVLTIILISEAYKSLKRIDRQPKSGT